MPSHCGPFEVTLPGGGQAASRSALVGAGGGAKGAGVGDGAGRSTAAQAGHDARGVAFEVPQMERWHKAANSTKRAATPAQTVTAGAKRTKTQPAKKANAKHEQRSTHMQSVGTASTRLAQCGAGMKPSLSEIGSTTQESINVRPTL